MYVDLSFEPYKITKPTYINIDHKNSDFPLLLIDKDSYIVHAVVETGLDQHMNDELYSLQIGKYSSLAEDILFMIDMDHNIYSVYQGVINEYRDNTNLTPLKESKQKKRKGEIIIGNDCWIGNGATIMNGVIIHNGAVVAAKSVVTKDVEPYTIVGGNPARVIGKRFDQETIDALRIIRWWDWSSEIIKSERKYITGDVDLFVKKYLPEAVNSLYNRSNTDPFYQRTIESGKIYVYMVDEDHAFPTYKRIINEFCKSFFNNNAQLVIYFPNELIDIEKTRNDVLTELDNYIDCDCCISLVYDKKANIESIIKNCDTYITSRSRRNIFAIGLAEIFGKEIISGFNIPLFE